MAETITLEEFKRVDLRVGEVVSCERVEGTDRLLKLTVDLGNETRQLVAGIAAHYEPRHLIGVQIVVVCNLKPAVIRGIESGNAACRPGRPSAWDTDTGTKGAKW